MKKSDVVLVEYSRGVVLLDISGEKVIHFEGELPISKEGILARYSAGMYLTTEVSEYVEDGYVDEHDHKHEQDMKAWLQENIEV